MRVIIATTGHNFLQSQANDLLLQGLLVLPFIRTVVLPCPKNVGMFGLCTDNFWMGIMGNNKKTQLECLGSFFRPKDAEQAGLSYDALRALVKVGFVERVSWGLYHRVNVEPTENHSLAAVCARVPAAIVCLLSALQVHGIGTRLPAEVWLAVPNKARPPQMQGIKIRLARFSGPALTYGVVPTEFEGVHAHITDPARTIVDCFRFQNRIGKEAAKEALYDALRQKIVTVDELYRALDVVPSIKLRAVLEAMP
jgi:predicted transcriptional regulator of viral defense system